MTYGSVCDGGRWRASSFVSADGSRCRTGKAACPPFPAEIAIGTARQLCEAGDQTMCQVFQMLGGEIDGEVRYRT
jgi:hypothetical protein